jgi:hypothetical protein
MSDAARKKLPAFLKPEQNYVYISSRGEPITNSLLVAKWLCQGSHAEVLQAVADLKAVIGEPSLYFNIDEHIWPSHYYDERREKVHLWEMDSDGAGFVCSLLRRSAKKKGQLYVAMWETKQRLKELGQVAREMIARLSGRPDAA